MFSERGVVVGGISESAPSFGAQRRNVRRWRQHRGLRAFRTAVVCEANAVADPVNDDHSTLDRNGNRPRFGARPVLHAWLSGQAPLNAGTGPQGPNRGRPGVPPWLLDNESISWTALAIYYHPAAERLQAPSHSPHF